MSVLVALQHVTRYRYDRPVGLGPQIVRLRPAPHCRTAIRVLFAEGHAGRTLRELAAGPERKLACAFRVSRAHDRVQHHGRSPRRHVGHQSVRFLRRSVGDEFSVRLSGRVRRGACALSFASEPAGPLLAEYLKSISREPQNIVDFLVALNQRLQRDIRYLVRMDPGVQAPEDTLKLASGSCRDTAWLLVQILRHLGLAARFVSGYLIQLVPDLKALDGPAGIDCRLHRSARLDRSLPSGRRLDRARSDVGIADRRGTSAARRDAALPRRSADQRRRRGGRASSSPSR